MATGSPGGAVAAVFALDPADAALRVVAWGPGADWLMNRAAEVSGLADAPADVEDHPVVRRFARRARGLRLVALGRVWETAIATVLEQKVTSADAHRSWGRLVRGYGSPAPGPAGDAGMMVPPPPEVVGALDEAQLHRLGIERKRIRPMWALALEAGRLERAAALGSEALGDVLPRLVGIGPWTTAWVRHYVCADPDVVPIGDLHLPHLVAWNLAGERWADDERMLELLAPFAGQRGRVARLVKVGGVGRPRRRPELSPNRMLLDGSG